MTGHISDILRQNEDLWNQFTFKNTGILNQEYLDTPGVVSDKFFTEPYMSDYLTAKGYKVEYPDNAKFAVCLTHDVDDIYPPLHHTVLSSMYSVKNLSLQAMKDQASWIVKGKKYSPYINFKEIMSLEKRFDAVSSFYFIATDKDVTRFRYDIEDLNDRLGVIVDNGSEVGLHGGYYSSNSLEKIIAEKKRVEKVLNKPIIGNRFHYLQFKIPETWDHLLKAGFKYDTTIGNNRIAGFKNGLCHPYKPVDTVTNKEMDIVEIPLVLSDFIIMNTKISLSRKLEISKNIIDNAEKCGGVLTILWHSDAFNNSYRSDWVKFYTKLLEYCRAKNAWITSGEKIYEWAGKNL
jgi:hypothetical protein